MAYSRTQKKYVAVQRARRRLQQQLDNIDWELDVLQPELADIAIQEAKQNVEIEAGGDDVVDQDDA